MSVELLSQLESREHLDRFGRWVKKHTVRPEVWVILEDMKVWLDKRPKETTVDWTKFAEWFKLRNPKISAEQSSVYDRIFDRLIAKDYDPSSVEDIVEAFLGKDFGMRLIEFGTKLAEGEDVDIVDLEQLTSEHYAEIGMINSLDQFEVTNDLDELITKSESGGYNWKLKFLNQSIGSCRKGKLYVVGASPNSGKTTFMSSEYMEIVKQLPEGQVALWFNNEEDGFDVKWRHWEALLERPKEEIEANPAKAKADIEKKIGSMNKVVLIDKSNVSMNDVNAYLKKYEGRIGLIVFDQLHKINGSGPMASSDVDKLIDKFNWAREIAKRVAPVITSHQVSFAGEGLAYPPMSALYGSKTGVQGEADVIIMLGNELDPANEFTRYISVAKCKGVYGPMVDRSKRNGKTVVLLEPDQARFKEA
jgi:hypothetical protein